MDDSGECGEGGDSDDSGGSDSDESGGGNNGESAVDDDDCFARDVPNGDIREQEEVFIIIDSEFDHEHEDVQEMRVDCKRHRYPDEEN